MNARYRPSRMIPFNRPTLTGHENQLLAELISGNQTGPEGDFTQQCQDWLTDRFRVPLALPTGSCTAALEMSAILLDLKPGDELILPSFTYPSSATAFARAGVKLVFVDIEPATMNIDPEMIAAAITERTKAVLVIHYAGTSCDIDRILQITEKYNLALIEDAAPAFLSKHMGRYCGALGTLGCFSFHESKSIQCGQGGAILVNNPDLVTRAEIILEKGTDRRRFLNGEVDRYSWQDLGSSYSLENIRSAYLWGQLQHSDAVVRELVKLWHAYHKHLSTLESRGLITLPKIPEYAEPNGHIFWMKANDAHERTKLIAHLKNCGVQAVFHYVPLHSSPAGKRYGRFEGQDNYTSREAARLVRLPLFYGFSEVDYVVESIYSYFNSI